MKIIIYLFFLLYVFIGFKNYIFRSLLYVLGFKIDLDSFKNLPSKLILIGNHTSMYDFFISTAIYFSYFHKDYTNYVLMKDQFEYYTSILFHFFDKKLKIISVNKNKSGLTKQLIEELKFKNNYILFIAPEGTRKYTESIKSGYWILSKELNVDVSFVGINFQNKTLTLEPPREVNYNWELEKKIYESIAEKYLPLFPEKCVFTKNKII